MDRDAIRRFRLGAHHLVRRLPARSLTVAAAAAGLQDTPPGSAVIGLVARVDDLTPKAVTAALISEKSLVQVWSRRGSPYLIPTEDLDVFTRGLLPRDDDGHRVVLAGLTAVLDDLGMSATEATERASAGIGEILDNGQLSKRELGVRLARFFPRSFRPWFEPDRFSAFTALLVRTVALEGGFLIAPRGGHEATFVRTDQWLGRVPTFRSDEEARREMLRRYLRCYGPATPGDYANWAGIARADAEWSWSLLRDEWADTEDGTILRADARRLRGTEPSGLRLLPPYDAYLAGTDRETIVPDRGLHRRIWRSSGNPGVVLSSGLIVGTWRPQKRGRRLKLNVAPFGRMSKAERARVDEEAGIVGRHREADDVEVVITD